MLCYDIMISMDGVLLITKVPGVANTIFYAFGEGEMKRDLFFNFLGISIHLEKMESFILNDFAIEEGTKELLDFFAIINLAEEEKLKTLVKQYLHEDMTMEQFEEAIIPHRVARKLSE